MQYVEKIGYKSAANVRVKIETIDTHPFHMHKDAIELIFVLRGCIDIWDCAATYVLRKGAVHVFNRNDAHRISRHVPEATDRETAGEENIVMTLHIDYNHYSDWFDKMRKAYFVTDTSDGTESSASEMKYLRFLLARIAREYFGTCSALLLENYTTELIGYLEEQFQDYFFYVTDAKHVANIAWLQSTGQGFTPGGLQKDYDRVHRIADYMDEHYAAGIQLKTLARLEQVSEAYMSKYIRKNLGVTFSEYMSLIRCEEASKLLASTDQTVDQIAQSSGFSDRKELARNFSKWYHYKPSEYRKEIKKDLGAGAIVIADPVPYEAVSDSIDRWLDEY